MSRLPTADVRLTREKLHHYIRTKLGGTRFAVELDEQQIDIAIDDAIRLFRRYTFGRNTIAQPQVIGIQKFALPSNCFGITRYDVLTTDRPSFAESEMNVFELNRSRIYGLYGDRPGALQWLLMHVEQSRRVRGTEPEYWHVTDGGVNDIVCYVPSGPRDVSYDVALNIEKIEDISYTHEQLFIKCVEAYCRMILGDMRGKYGGALPGSTGDLQLDAEKQSTRGTTMETEVTEELRKLSLAMPPVTG